MIVRPSITLRFGASHDDITVDGRTFRRNQLTKGEFAFVRNVIIDALIKVGSLKRRGRP